MGDMAKFCLFNIDRGARAKTGKGRGEEELTLLCKCYMYEVINPVVYGQVT